MPKLDNTHLSSRISRELERLKKGEALVIRNIKAVLSAEQWAATEAAWAEQKQLHRGKRPRDEKQRKEWGMRDKREIYMEALENALVEAKSRAMDYLQQSETNDVRRQIEIYTDTVNDAREEGKVIGVARNIANNDLTRAGLNRLDKARRGLNRRDKEVNELEEQLKARLRADMTDEEREQEALFEEHQKWKNS